MMLTEGSQPPSSIPWHDAPGGIPVASVLVVPEDGLWDGELLPGGRHYERHLWAASAIPEDIKAVYGPWLNSTAHHSDNAYFRVYSCGSYFATSSGRSLGREQARGNPNLPNWAGYYSGDGHGNPSHSTTIAFSSGGQTLVHEYGHGVDCMYHNLWNVDHSATTWLSDEALFLGLSARAIPGIPDGTYAKTNRREWFAEAWTFLVCGTNSTGRTSDADFTTYVAGGDAGLAAEIKAAFEATFPGQMPVFPRVLPALAAPVISKHPYVPRASSIAYVFYDDDFLDSQATLSSSNTEYRYTCVTFDVSAGDEENTLLVDWQWAATSSGTWTDLYVNEPYPYDLVFINNGDGTKPWVRARVHNSLGEAFTNPYLLHSIEGPTVTTHPATQSAAVGDAITFTVAGTNYDSITWQAASGGIGWADIAGATGTTLNLTADTDPAFNQMYFRAILHKVGAKPKASNNAVLTVTVPASVAPEIITQPTGGDFNIGATTTLAAAATGATSQQWQSSPDGTTWTNVSGATTISLALTAGTAPAVNGPVYFRCVFTNSAGSTNTDGVIVGTRYLTSYTAVRPAINGNSGGSVEVPTVGDITFTTPAVSCYPTPTYQWKSGASPVTATMTNISGATGTTYVGTPGVSPATNLRYFRVQVTNSVGTYNSAAIQLLVGFFPTITQQPSTTPQTYTLASGTTHTLTAAYTGGDPAPTILWTRIKNDTEFSEVSGQTTTTFSQALSAANGYSTGTWKFYMSLVNSRGSVSTQFSGTVTLT